MSQIIFISHSSQDKVQADIVCATLESQGIACWIAPRDVPPGVSYAEAILNAIYACRVLLLVFSSKANASPQVLREVERASAKRVPLLTLKIEEVAMTPSLEFFLSVHHWLSAADTPLEAVLDRLVEAVRQLVTGSPVSSPVGPGAENRNPSLPILYQVWAARGPEAGRIFPLHNERITVGRSRDCDIVLPDRHISRSVCSLNWDDAYCGFVLVDHASRNRVFLNGERMDEWERQLAIGDEILIGGTLLILELHGTTH